MHVVSVNIGKQETIQINDKAVATGIFKHPVREQISINTNGLVGDTIGNTAHHGGVDQAVYIYSAEDYAWWETELQRELPIGTLGENLTLSSFGTIPLRFGDRFSFG
jgi:MOSC domain-containing protein YiiM